MSTATLNDSKIFTSIREKRRGEKMVDYQHIIKIIELYFDTSMSIISGASRKSEIRYPRQVAMFIMGEYTRLPWRFIGNLFGGRDHTTAINASHTIQNLMDTEPATKTQVEEIIKLVLS